MELLLDTGVSGHPAVDTASVSGWTEPGSVPLELCPPSRPKPDLPQVQIDHRTDDDQPNVSDRDIAEARRTEPAARPDSTVAVNGTDLVSDNSLYRTRVQCDVGDSTKPRHVLLVR